MMFTSKPPVLSIPDDELLFVHAHLLELLAKQKWVMCLGVVAVSVVFVVIGFQQALLWYWVAWLALVAAGLAMHLQIRSAVVPTSSLLECKKLLKRNVYLELLNGVMQSLCLFAFPYLTDNERALYTLIFLCIAVGDITNTAGYQLLYWGFTAPIIALLSFVWLYYPSQGHSDLLRYFTGVLILFPLVPMLWVFSQSSWALFEESCRLRFRERVLNAQLQEALALAEQANRAKSRFLASASHDLRQPLHVIGFIGSALKLRQLDDKSTEMVNLLNKASSSLQSLLNSLLDVSKLDSGLLEVQQEPVSIRRLVEDFYQSYASLVFAKGLTPRLTINADESHPLWTITDSVLLLRILNNLGQNALKFTQNGEISIQVTLSSNEYVIEIKDTGCGIAAEHQEEIFHEFFQVGNHERDVTQGLGLGLSIVRRVAGLLNIRLELHSTEGRGTSVFLYVPIIELTSAQLGAHRGLLGQQEEVVSQGKGKGLKVLVIDDEANVLEASKLLLEQLGCECWVAADVEQAHEQMVLMQPHRPDLMMVDFRLKGECNGIEVIRILQQKLGEPPVKAIIISGDTEPERLLLADKAGIQICHKPLTLEKLDEQFRLLER